jgi:predicted aldo/keto reductase-like oxidoreductase
LVEEEVDMSRKEMDLSRRNFLKAAGAVGIGSLVTATGTWAGKPEVLAESRADHPLVPTRPFGKTGVDVSILSVGGIFDITSNQLVLHQALNWGVTYWDTAASYVGGKSEIGIGMYLEKQPEARKRIFLVTKSGASSARGMTKHLNRSFERMKTDYIDLFFMHGIRSIREADDEMKAWAEKAKSAGKIRFFGFSTHSNMEECLLPAAKLGWIDGIMMTYNYRFMNTDKMKAAVDACAKAGVGLTAMKTQARSFWASVGKETDVSRRLIDPFTTKGFTEGQAKLKAVWENPQIASICSEMPNMTLLKSNIAAALDKTKLSAGDVELLEEHARGTCADYCTGCTHICESLYAGEAPIGDVIRYLMYYHSYGESDRARALFAELPSKTRRRIPTLDYSVAERECPQGIPIGSFMREAATILA